MADRGGFVDPGGGFFGDRPQQLPPSLLQMAQGIGPAGGGGQPGGTWAAPAYDADAIVRSFSGGGGGDGSFGGGGGFDGGGWGDLHTMHGPAGISPEDKAKYFDASGGYKIEDPQKVAADAGMSLAQLSSGFLPRHGRSGIGYDFGSDQGGFFTIEDMSRTMGRSVPGIATHQMNAPSTNNWRLLGMGPGWIMRNGSLINTQAGEVGRGGHIGSDMGGGITAEHGMGVQRGSQLGTGAAMGTPNRWGDSFYWPGAATGGFADRWPANTNV